MVRCHFHQCHKPTGWRIFWITTVEAWDISTSLKFIACFLPSSCHVIFWPLSGFLHSARGAENRARYGIRVRCTEYVIQRKKRTKLNPHSQSILWTCTQHSMPKWHMDIPFHFGHAKQKPIRDEHVQNGNFMSQLDDETERTTTQYTL